MSDYGKGGVNVRGGGGGWVNQPLGGSGGVFPEPETKTETRRRRAGWYYDNYLGQTRPWVTWTWISVAILAFLWAVIGSVYALGVRFERQACRTYSERTLQDAELVNMTFMSWECFVRVDGHWIPRDQIRTIGEQP